MFYEGPMPILLRLHLDEAQGGLRGLYSLLAAETVETDKKSAPPKKIPGTCISKRDLCTMLGIFIDKLNKMQDIDDKARDSLSAADENRPDEGRPPKKRPRRAAAK